MLTTKYITKDDLYSYAGIDLAQELGSTEQADAFLIRIETRLEAFLDARMHQNVSLRYPTLTDNQRYHHKLALLEQAIYVWKNGETSVDSGYDPQEGVKIRQGDLIDLTVCRNAKEHLILAGLWTYKLGRRSGWLW